MPDVTRACLLEHAPLARRIARLAPSYLREDAESVAMVGIWEALQSFDATRGTSLRSHLSRRSRGAVKDFLREWDHLSRSQRGRVNKGKSDDVSIISIEAKLHSGMTLDQLLPDDHDSPETTTRLAEAMRRLDILPPRMARVLRARLDGETLIYIGRRIGVSESRVAQIQRAALARLREMEKAATLSSDGPSDDGKLG